MNLNLNHNPYNQRHSSFGAHGVVATSQTLAAQAGLEILQAGGNAVDAAIATAACLTVVEPTSNGLGGDAFALVWDGNTLHGLNGSGRAPSGLSLESFPNRQMPQRGWLTVTVPGVIAAWRDLHQKFGRLEFGCLLQRAIDYAENGFVVSPTVARFWASAAKHYVNFPDWQNTFLANGRTPYAGEKFYMPHHAKTLRQIGSSYGNDFYTGALGAALEQYAKNTGGVITQADLAAHQSTWVKPIGTNYRGYDIWEIPPNGQGVAALTALNILEGFEVQDDLETLHRKIESMKLAFVDAKQYVADPENAVVPTKGMLDKKYAAQRRLEIGTQALLPQAGTPPAGGTVYLCCADSDGMMVSFIQSNYAGFGSGLVVPNTGIALQNRGANFSLEPNHANCVAPNKRPYHTIIPAFMSKDGNALGAFGVMGGFMQPQGHLQVVSHTIDHGLHPQAALDAPRWQWIGEKRIELEPHTPRHLAEGLRSKGHEVTLQLENGSFGRGQIIWRHNDAYVAGSDSRCDGAALVY
ncbi:MAG: gamma-glutamyltransferase family protein [Deinococcales bacterium]